MNTLRSTALGLALALSGPALFAAAPPPAERPADDVQDVLFLSEGRPVRIRLHVRVDGKPYAARWDDFTARLFNYLDRDNDGVLDKKEAVRAPNPQQLQQLFSGNAYLYPNGPAVSFDEMDADSDGKVTLAEFRRYYAKGVARPVQVAPGYGRFDLRTTALTEALFQALDTNKDGKLSRAELLAAPKVLLAFDQDDDELISAQEVLGGGPRVTSDVEARRLAAEALLRARGGPAASPLVLVEKDESGKRMSGRLAVARQLLA